MSEFENEIPTPDRPEWLPSNFTSPEALATSYTEAQRKITQQGNELAELREQLEAYQNAEEMSDDYVLPQQYEHQDLYTALENPELLQQQMVEQANGLFPGLTREQQLELIVANAVKQVDEQYGNRTPEQLYPDQVFGMAENLAAQNIPNWPAAKDRVADVLAGSPELYTRAQRAVNTGDVAELSRVFLDAANPNSPASLEVRAREVAAREQDLMERNKLAAQSAVGAGPGRSAPADAAKSEWARVVEAGRPSPWQS